MALDTWYLNTEGTLRVRPQTLLVGEERLVSIDCNAYTGSKSTTANSVSITHSGEAVEISAATLSGGVATCEVRGVSVGRATVTFTLTLANGEVLVRRLLVTVIDPFEDEADGYN